MARKTETSDQPTRRKRLPAPKLDNDEVSLGWLLELINGARSQVLEARKMDEPVLSFERVRASLREAYFMLNGEQNDLVRNTEIGSRRLLPYLLVNFGAQNLQRMALEVLENGESADGALKLLDRCRELTMVIERHLFGQEPPKDVPNVVDLIARKAHQQSRAEGSVK